MKTINITQLIFIFILTNIIAINGNILVGTNNGTQFELTAVEIIYLKSNNQRIVDSITLQPTINEDDVYGKIFIFESGITDDIIIQRVQAKGALAVINLSVAYVVGGYLRYRFTDHEAIQAITIPIFEVVVVDKDHIWPLLQQNQVSNITLLPNDETNPWDLVLLSPGYYAYTVILMVFCVTNIALAIWKMTLFIDLYGGIRVSFSLAVLFLEVISNLIRIAGLIDLFGVNSLYDEFTATVFYMMSFPFVLASIMLFSLYWHEIMTSSSIVVHPFIVKMRVPFFVLSGLLLLFQVAAILVRKFLVSNFALIGTLIYLVISVALFIFYVTTASKLLQRLQASTKKGRKFRNLKQTTIKILISVCFLFGMIVVGAQFAFDAAYTPIGYFMCWYTLYLTINCSSMLNILAFGSTKKSMSTSQSDKKPSTSNKQSSASTSTNNIDLKETTVTV